MEQQNASEAENEISPSEDPALQRLLKGMDPALAASFSDLQLAGLRDSIRMRGWKGHSIDLRPTLVIPFLPWSFYLVFLVGRNRRHITRSEATAAALSFLLIFVIGGMAMLGLLLVILYIIKSALGIDIIPAASIGIWDELKQLLDD